MLTMACLKHRTFLAFAACLLGLPQLTFGADNQTGIIVSGKGNVSAMPNTVELSTAIIGSAELAGDAVKKFHNNKRRALAALKKLKIKGLTVEGRGMSLMSVDVYSGCPLDAMPIIAK